MTSVNTKWMLGVCEEQMANNCSVERFVLNIDDYKMCFNYDKQQETHHDFKKVL